MSKNLEKIIDYIDDNYRFGSTISRKTVVDLMEKYEISQEEIVKVYDELDSLQIKLIDEERVCLQDFDDSFLDDFDLDDLDLVLEDDEFKSELDQLKDVVDKRYNLQYIEEYQSESETKEQRREILNNIVEANENLVWKLVMKYKNYSTTTFDLEDMCQVGMQGLLKAVEKFDLTKDNAFSTYAIWWIRQAILRAIADSSTTIRIPVHMYEQLQKYTHFINKFWMDNNRYPTEKEIAENFNVPIEKVLEWEQYKQYANIKSLDLPIGENQENTIVEFIEDSEQTPPEEVVEAMALKEELIKLIKTKLTSREAYILDFRFGLSDDIVHTLEEIGEMEHITRERVRQIEAKALNKLKTKYNKERLKDFYYD